MIFTSNLYVGISHKLHLNMSDHELLMELVADKRRREKIEIVKYTMLATLIIIILTASFIIVNKITKTFETYNQIITDLQNSNNHWQNLFDSFDFSNNNNQEVLDYLENIKELLKKFGIGF